jgi:hypothetical protein
MSFLSALFGSRKTEDMIYYDKRCEPRYPYTITTELMDSGRKLWSCKIVDMSERGLGISTRAPLKVGSSLNIVKPNIVAEVLWAKDHRAGLKPIK